MYEPALTDNQAEFRILVVDGEIEIVSSLRTGLAREGFTVETARDADAALKRVRIFRPHLIILDLMLPEVDGLDLAEQLMRDPDLAIIMLTRTDQAPDRMMGVNSGADDYIVKPFDYDEMVARVRAVARRSPVCEDTLRADGIVLDQARREVTVAGATVDLTFKEFELLRLFLLRRGQVLPRQVILDRIWGYDFFGTENSVEVYIGYLRRKLKDNDHRLLETVRGVGYRLNA
jgi:DNA-binding response OmpR family regulator